jgi:hypothetical protein
MNKFAAFFLFVPSLRARAVRAAHRGRRARRAVRLAEETPILAAAGARLPRHGAARPRNVAPLQAAQASRVEPAPAGRRAEPARVARRPRAARTAASPRPAPGAVKAAQPDASCAPRAGTCLAPDLPAARAWHLTSPPAPALRAILESAGTRGLPAGCHLPRHLPPGPFLRWHARGRLPWICLWAPAF